MKIARSLMPALCGLLMVVAAGAGEAGKAQRDGQHDFDFEFGTWRATVSRLTKPLTGSITWVKYEGPSVVHKVWDGRANLGEIDLAGPAGKIRGISLRLYDSAARQWRISWANAADGLLGTAMVGAFENGRGEFYDQETYLGRAVFVRFIFSDITTTTFKLEQAFSPDGGKSWEPNWIATFKREADAAR